MIIHHLNQTSQQIDYKGHAPEFIFDATGYANYILDDNTSWFIHVPIMSDRMTFDRVQVKTYNIQVYMMAVSEMEREVDFYHPIIKDIIIARDKWLLLLDNVRDELGRKLLEVQANPQIITQYIPQSNAFDVPCTGISFNLPIVYNSYEPLC
jgi:hypothetical protein